MKTGYVIFERRDVPNDVSTFVNLLKRWGGFTLVVEGHDDGGAEVNFTGADVEVDTVLEVLASGTRTVMVQRGVRGDA